MGLALSSEPGEAEMLVDTSTPVEDVTTRGLLAAASGLPIDSNATTSHLKSMRGFSHRPQRHRRGSALPFAHTMLYPSRASGWNWKMRASPQKDSCALRLPRGTFFLRTFPYQDCTLLWSCFESQCLALFLKALLAVCF